MAARFPGFPKDNENVIARNLVWDMMGIEQLSLYNPDSLKLNTAHSLSNITGGFNMAEIGNYDHRDIEVSWNGISAIDREICDLISYRALYNRLELTMGDFSSKGTEQYWGTSWISRENRSILYAEMYSDTYQELKIPGLADKMQIKTVRELKVEKIR